MTDTNLVDRLITLRARLGALPVRLGVPQYQHPVVLSLGGTYEPMEPAPKVDLVSPTGTSRFFSTGTWLTDQVQIQGDEYLVTGVPRTYSLEDLREALWLVDAVPGPNNTWTGQRCTCVWVDRNLTVTWSAVLAPRKTK